MGDDQNVRMPSERVTSTEWHVFCHDINVCCVCWRGDSGSNRTDDFFYISEQIDSIRFGEQLTRIESIGTGNRTTLVAGRVMVLHATKLKIEKRLEWRSMIHDDGKGSNIYSGRRWPGWARHGKLTGTPYTLLSAVDARTSSGRTV